MKHSDLHPEKNAENGRHPVVLAIIAGGAFVALLLAIAYLGNKLETLEERLKYSAPAVTRQSAADAYGIHLASSQTVYIPVYSHIYSEGGEPHLLETTLSIRNSDPERGIVVTSARYFDTKGKLLQEYLEGSKTLGPLETMAILVEKRDTRGGSGANFIVAWEAAQPVYEPIIEAVMVGGSKTQSISFKSPGRPLVKRSEETSTPD